MENKEKINLIGSKIGYACGDIFNGGAFMIFSLFFMNYLLLVEKIPVSATAIIMFVGEYGMHLLTQ